MVVPVPAIAGLVHDVVPEQGTVGDVARDIEPAELVHLLLPLRQVEPVAVGVLSGGPREADEDPAVRPSGRFQHGQQVLVEGVGLQRGEARVQAGRRQQQERALTLREDARAEGDPLMYRGARRRADRGVRRRNRVGWRRRRGVDRRRERVPPAGGNRPAAPRPRSSRRPHRR